MAYDGITFAAFFTEVLKYKTTSLASYNTNLRKIDKAIGGLDEFIEAHGIESFSAWMREQGEQFHPYSSNVRSAAKAYIRCRVESPLQEEVSDLEATPEENAASVFKYEKELQDAVRSQLHTIEAGLVVADSGSEAAFDTGRSDILARDARGRGVVVELKAGMCPKGTIEQVLGYAQDWADTGEPSVRAIIIAGEFSPRLVAAAKRIPDLQLKTYRLQVKVEDV